MTPVHAYSRGMRLRDMCASLSFLALTALAPGASASDGGAALRLGVFASDDADDTFVLKTTAGGLLGYHSPDRYHGIVVEDVQIRPAGGAQWRDQRAYYAFATGETWKSKGLLGTDGDTLVGSVSTVREGRIRQEYFVERDLLETEQGIAGLYYTFAGAAYDIPLGRSDRHQVTALVGAQDFTGSNFRSHVRARYVAVVRPDLGLSVQLRARAFHNSTPFEFDYYSPEWFAEALPVVQIRRFRQRWMYAAAVGWGRQRDSESAWRDARLIEASITSPRAVGRGYLRASAVYSNTPIGAGASYGYRQLAVEWIVPF